MDSIGLFRFLTESGTVMIYRGVTCCGSLHEEAPGQFRREQLDSLSVNMVEENRHFKSLDAAAQFVQSLTTVKRAIGSTFRTIRQTTAFQQSSAAETLCKGGPWSTTNIPPKKLYLSGVCPRRLTKPFDQRSKRNA